MMAKYPFPDDIRDPNRQGPNPFADDAADENPSAEQVTDSTIFATNDRATEYQPEYQAVLSNRSVLHLLLGGLGLVASLVGWTSLGDLELASLLMPLPFLSLAASVPALLGSLADLRAMKSGAMKADRRGLARVACLLGLFGTVTCLLFIARVIMLYFEMR